MNRATLIKVMLLMFALLVPASRAWGQPSSTALDVRALLRQALAYADKVGYAGANDELLTEIARAQAQADDAETASQTALRIKEIHWKQSATEAAACAYARVGDLQSARRLVAPFLEDYNRDSWEFRFAIAQADRGDLAGAFRTVSRIKPTEYAFEYMPALSKGKPTDIAAALEEVSRIATPERRAMAFAVVALIQARDADKTAARRTLDRALQSISEIKQAPEAKAGANLPGILLLLSTAQAKAFDFPGALKTVEQTLQPKVHYFYAFGLLEIGKAQLESGDKPGARQTLHRVYAPLAAVESETSDFQAGPLYLLIGLQMRAGEPQAISIRRQQNGASD